MAQLGYQASIHNPLISAVATLKDLDATAVPLETSSDVRQVWFIEMDARSAGGQETHIKMGTTSSWANGTDDAHMVVRCVTDKKRTALFPFGMSFPTQLHAACSVEAGGGSASQTDPTGTINVKIGYAAV